MGAGRQTQTFLAPASAGPSGGGALGPPPQRNLGKSELGGVIFGCTHVTMNECLTKNLFGLPMQHIKYVQHIRPGMCLFLFNFSGRLLHGIYEAVGEGSLNIDPSAWTEGKGKTNFPAQVKFKIRQSCSPLPESVFKEAILDNYFAEVKFTFELTIAQKDRLVALFVKNMQGPSKSLSSNVAPYQQKPGGVVKGWKKAGEGEGGAWGKTKTFVPAIGNAWQKTGPLDIGKGTSDDVKSNNFHHPGKAKQEAAGNSPENIFDILQQVSDDNSVYSDGSRQDVDFPAVWGSTGQTSDVKNNEAGNDFSSERQELDIAQENAPSWGDAQQEQAIAPSWGDAQQEQAIAPSWGDAQQEQSIAPSWGEAQQEQSIAPSWGEAQQEQSIAPSWGEAQQEQPSFALEKFQGLEIASVDSQQQRDTSLQGGFQYNPRHEDDSNGGMVVALPPMRPPPAQWERQAKERAAMEQAMLKEDRERLWVTTSAVDMTTATAFKRSLEASAGTIAQMRQGSMDLHLLMLEVQSRAEHQLEQQKTVEKLQNTNAILEQSQRDMAGELAKLKSEMSELKLQVNTLNSQGYEHNNKFLYLSNSGHYADKHPASTIQQIPQPQELFILGGLADAWLHTVVAYSPVKNQFRYVAPLLGCRAYAATSVCHGSIYLYGGGDGTSWSDSVERYSTSSDKWETCASMAIKRGSLGGATVREKIYALGGGNGSTSFNDTECFDPIVGTWTASTRMLEKRFCVASAELNGAIYALGGFDGVNYLTSAERFDPREGIWTAIPPMSVQRGSLTAACLNGNLYALGGFDGGLGFLNSVEVYDPRANRWMLGPPMMSARAYGASVSFGDAIYTVGGMEFMNQSYQTSNMQMEVFREATGWQAVQVGNMINRNFVAAAVI